MERRLEEGEINFFKEKGFFFFFFSSLLVCPYVDCEGDCKLLSSVTRKSCYVDY